LIVEKKNLSDLYVKFKKCHDTSCEKVKNLKPQKCGETKKICRKRLIKLINKKKVQIHMEQEIKRKAETINKNLKISKKSGIKLILLQKEMKSLQFSFKQCKDKKCKCVPKSAIDCQNKLTVKITNLK